MTRDPYPVHVHFCVRVYSKPFVTVREVTLECEGRQVVKRCESDVSGEQARIWVWLAVGSRSPEGIDRALDLISERVSRIHHDTPSNLGTGIVTEIAGTFRAWVRDCDCGGSWEDPSRLTFERWAAEMENVGIPPRREPSWEAVEFFEALRPPPPPPRKLPADILVNAEVVAEVEAIGREMERAILMSVL